MESKENETYLKLKLAEKEREVELAQSKIKDLQLRLIRYLFITIYHVQLIAMIQQNRCCKDFVKLYRTHPTESWATFQQKVSVLRVFLRTFTAQKMKISIKDLVTLTKEILNGKFHILCSVCKIFSNSYISKHLLPFQVFSVIHFRQMFPFYTP